jgi:hypothetical protein
LATGDTPGFFETDSGHSAVSNRRSIQHGVTGVGQDWHVVAHLDQSQVDQRTQIGRADRQHLQPLRLDIPERPSQADGAIKVELDERTAVICPGKPFRAGSFP